MYKIFPSLMSAPLLYLGRTIAELNEVAQGFHIDVMDLHFAPNLTFGPDVIQEIARATPLPVWIHLMINEPARIINRLVLRPIDLVSVHAEIDPSELSQALSSLRAQQARISIAINPETPVTVLLPHLSYCDQVLIMAVDPGFAGQELMPTTLHKVDALCTLRKHYPKQFAIGLDGGVNRKTLHSLAAHSVDMLAIGSAIFQAVNPVAETVWFATQ